jgi:hypothetical protein
MADFRVRALEIHSTYAWDFAWVRKALLFIREHELSALVLHRNDIVDRVVYPGRYFGAEPGRRNIFERYRDIHRQLYKYTPTRRSGHYHRRDYLNRVIELAARDGIEVWLENKELFFPDILLELNPQLTKNGTLCPSEPFWPEFLETKYSELFEDIPGVAGIICAPATGESRLSISANRCTCELCRKMTPAAWYSQLILAMHRPIKRAGKELVIRDFVFDRKAQNELAEALERLPEDVVISLKNTPHDYYPTFPDNPRIGHVGPHRQWLEFDCMAQYFGWGVGPAIMIEDQRARLERGRAAGIEGVLLRTDWESLDGHSAFHTPNMLNLHSGAALGVDLAAPARAIYRRWLIEEGMIEPDTDTAAIDTCADWVERLIGDSWQVVRRALYANDCVFCDSSTFPVSLDHAWWLAEEKNSLKDWMPEKSDALSPAWSNVERLLAEKDEALRIVQTTRAVLDERPGGLRERAYQDLRHRYEVFERYVRGFRAVGRACFLVRHLEGPADPAAPPRAELEAMARRELDGLLGLAQAYDEFRRDLVDSYVVDVLLSSERLRTLHDDLAGRLGPVAAPAAP